MYFSANVVGLVIYHISVSSFSSGCLHNFFLFLHFFLVVCFFGLLSFFLWYVYFFLLVTALLETTTKPNRRLFRPITAGFYCPKQRQPPGTGWNRQSTGCWALKSTLSFSPNHFCFQKLLKGSVTSGCFLPIGHSVLLPWIQTLLS